GRCIDFYCGLTGSAASYGFFSPEVPDQVMADVTYLYPSGGVRTERVGAGGAETELRVVSMMFAYAKTAADKMDGRSLAAYALGRAPSAEQVAVSLSYHRTPSMADFCQGAVASRDEFYRGVFARRSRPRPQPTPEPR